MLEILFGYLRILVSIGSAWVLVNTAEYEGKEQTPYLRNRRLKVTLFSACFLILTGVLDLIDKVKSDQVQSQILNHATSSKSFPLMSFEIGENSDNLNGNVDERMK